MKLIEAKSGNLCELLCGSVYIVKIRRHTKFRQQNQSLMHGLLTGRVRAADS